MHTYLPWLTLWREGIGRVFVCVCVCVDVPGLGKAKVEVGLGAEYQNSFAFLGGLVWVFLHVALVALVVECVSIFSFIFLFGF